MDLEQQNQQRQLQQMIPANMLTSPNQYFPDPNPDLTGGLPISLDSLRDGPPGSKPFYPYSTLIRYAIKGSPTGKLLLEDIYYAIESRFPYFRTAPSGWKNSVRHNLSLNPCFEKVPRPLTDRGKGSYWTVNDAVDPRTGVHRIRKKKGKTTKGATNGASATGSDDPDMDVDYAPPVDGTDGDAGSGGGSGSPFDNAAYAVPQDIQQSEGASRVVQPPPPPPPPPPFAPVPPFPPSFDPTFPPHLLPPPPGIPGILPPFNADEAFDMDEHGNLDWKSMWKKELSQLIQVTEEQEKSGVDQEWFRIMLWKLRAAFFTPPPPPAGHPGHPPHPGLPAHHPHTPVLQPPPPPPNVGNPEGVVMGSVTVQQVQQDR